MLDFSRRLSLPSMIRYAAWRLGGGTEPIELTLRSGTRIWHSASDYGNAYEIFVSEVYRPVRRLENSDVQMIVDLGANVGFSALYFLKSFPASRVIAFEPHPAHIKRLLANLSLNGATERVELHRAAASNRNDRLSLSDRGMSSSLVKNGRSPDSLEVDVLDIFNVLRNQRIDILKMDIEGSEYDLLSDARFLALRASTIVMEWHRNDALPDEHAWLIGRLKEAGYEVQDVFKQEHLGMLWAFRNTTA
jgi:FkbM family methyltransferase